MTNTSEYAADGTTLLEVIRRLDEQGYGAQFAAERDRMIRCFSCRRESPAVEVHRDVLCRTEGASDPDDMVAVAAIRCPACAAHGTVALKYGPGATPEEADVLELLDGKHPGAPLPT